MPRKTSPVLTDAELRLMRILWKRGPATVAEVQGALPKKSPLAYNSVLTTLRVLEKKGYVRHEKSGRAFVYAAAVDAEKVNRSAVRYLLSRFFSNSPEQLLTHMVEDGDLSTQELERVRKLIDGASDE